MMGAAFKRAKHEPQLDRHKTSALFDRNSFTRGRVVTGKGTSDGSNPLDDLRKQPFTAGPCT
jgi:hypothetical protein